MGGEDKAEQLRDEILSTFRHLAEYWANLPDKRSDGSPMTIADRCNGVAFSICVALDGCGDLPPMILEAATPPDDGEEYDDEFAGVRVETYLHEFYYGGTP